jgi:predicted transglutaminase-like cysteine proteinase
MTATPDQLAELEAVNKKWNLVPYSAVPKMGEGPDVWKPAPDGGTWECRDYSWAKSIDLRSAGWSPLSLMDVLCWIESEPGAPQGSPQTFHSILGVQIDDDIWCLDNRVPQVYRWQDCPYPYKWSEQQMPGTDDYRDVSQTGLIA